MIDKFFHEFYLFVQRIVTILMILVIVSLMLSIFVGIVTIAIYIAGVLLK